MKNLKSCLYLALLPALLCGLFAGCAEGPRDSTPATEPAIQATQPSESQPLEFVFQYGDDEELTMAYEVGFVPQQLWGEMDKTVTLADFTGMVRSIVSETDPLDAAAFDGYMGTAGTIQAPADRSLAAIVLYYAAYVLEIPEHTWFSLCQSSDCWSTHAMALNDVMGDRWDEFKHLYCEEAYAGTFPHVYEGGYACEGFWDGSVDVAAYFSMLNRSTYDGRMYFDYDFENNTMHMDYAVSVEDGIRAATRFYVMCHQEELFMSSMQEYNAASAHKQPIEDYNIHDLVDSIGIGIHYNHAQTDWMDTEGKTYITGDSFYDKMISAWETFTGRDNQKAVLNAYKEKGFDTVHLTITWTPYMDPETCQIDPGFLDYVEYFANLILDGGMNCIIASNRDFANGNTAIINGEAVSNWMEPEYKDAVDKKVYALWSQVAERFKHYDQRVMFKPFVEPQQEIFPAVETGDYDYQAARMNELNRICLDAVRTVGGNSEKRPMILGPLWGQFFMETMIPPEDDYIIAYYHTYFSNNGAIGFYDLPSDAIPTDENGDFTEWSSENPILRAWVERTYDQIQVFKQKYDIPLIIGEFAPSMVVSEAEAIDMTTFVMQQAQDLGCPVIFWDGYFGDNGEAGDVGFYLLGKDEWRTPALFEAIMNEAAKRK